MLSRHLYRGGGGGVNVLRCKLKLKLFQAIVTRTNFRYAVIMIWYTHGMLIFLFVYFYCRKRILCGAYFKVREMNNKECQNLVIFFFQNKNET